MNKLIPNLIENKLKIYDYKRMVIENYENIYEITNKLIIIDHYNIEGENLKVNLLNQFIIEIYGDIQKITIK